MFASEPSTVGCDNEEVDALPQCSAVFAIHRQTGEPYLGRTGVLRRRLKRLMGIRGLRESIARVEFWPCGSRLESSLVLYETAKRLLPDRYIDFLKLRFPPYVKLVMSNAFPRTQITTKLGGPGLCYGPFRSRANAELFERQMLDLFQLRRCQEDLVPSPDHPGCIYGEMSMCLRPCQEMVGAAEYATEAQRVQEFLSTSGTIALQAAEASRDRLSAEMEFEAAARQHKRVERIQEVLRSRDDLARDVRSHCGVAVTAGHEPGSVLLWFLQAGSVGAPVPFASGAAESISMDGRLREVVAGLSSEAAPAIERQEHLALLARWYYSSWRDGAWIPFSAPAKVPYRRIVAAVSRTVHQNAPAASQ